MTTISDFSPKPKIVSISGNAVIASGYGKFGSASLYCPDNGSFLHIEDNIDLNLFSNEYTIECWIKPSGDYSVNNTIITKRSEASGCAWSLYLKQTDGRLTFYNGTEYNGSVAPQSGIWSHVAAVYNTGNLSLYLNGTGILSSGINNINVNAPIYIGSYPDLSEQYKGYIDDLRMTKGVSGARYLGNFTPPVGPFPLTGTSITGPSNPLNLDNTFGNAVLFLSWNTPIDDNGSEIIEYVLEYTENNNNTLYTNIGNTGLSYTLSGLNNGSLYTLRVAGINIAGTGQFSNLSSGIPATVPSTTFDLSIATGDSTLTLAWAAPFNGGRPITDYIVEYTSGEIVDILNTNSSNTTYTISDLTNGDTYTFRVAASNIIGTGQYSEYATGIPATIPDTPTNVSMTQLAARLSLSWSDPYDGGSPLTDYAIQYSTDNGLSWTNYDDGIDLATSLNFTGLAPNNTYVSRVAAVNIFGTGNYSDASNSGFLAEAPACDLSVTGLPDVISSNYVYQIMNLVYIENTKNTIYELNYDINTGSA